MGGLELFMREERERYNYKGEGLRRRTEGRELTDWRKRRRKKK